MSLPRLLCLAARRRGTAPLRPAPPSLSCLLSTTTTASCGVLLARPESRALREGGGSLVNPPVVFTLLLYRVPVRASRSVVRRRGGGARPGRHPLSRQPRAPLSVSHATRRVPRRTVRPVRVRAPRSHNEVIFHLSRSPPRPRRSSITICGLSLSRPVSRDMAAHPHASAISRRSPAPRSRSPHHGARGATPIPL